MIYVLKSLISKKRKLPDVNKLEEEMEIIIG